MMTDADREAARAMVAGFAYPHSLLIDRIATALATAREEGRAQGREEMEALVTAFGDHESYLRGWQAAIEAAALAIAQRRASWREQGGCSDQIAESTECIEAIRALTPPTEER